MQIAIQPGPIDPRAVEAQVAHGGCGAVLSFIGVVRDNHQGRSVTGIEYQAWPRMCAKVAQDIGAEIRERWPHARVALVHRTGRLDIGEASIVIAASAPHRAEAYEASRHCIDRVKALLPVWKRELYVEGDTRWVHNAECAPVDA